MAGNLETKSLVTHRKLKSDACKTVEIIRTNTMTGYTFNSIMKAYETFGDAANHQALKIMVEME